MAEAWGCALGSILPLRGPAGARSGRSERRLVLLYAQVLSTALFYASQAAATQSASPAVGGHATSICSRAVVCPSPCRRLRRSRRGTRARCAPSRSASSSTSSRPPCRTRGSSGAMSAPRRAARRGVATRWSRPLSLSPLSPVSPPLHPHPLPYHTPHQCSPLTLSSLLSTHASPLSALSPRAATRCFHPLASFGCLSPSP